MTFMESFVSLTFDFRFRLFQYSVSFGDFVTHFGFYLFRSCTLVLFPPPTVVLLAEDDCAFTRHDFYDMYYSIFNDELI